MDVKALIIEQLEADGTLRTFKMEPSYNRSLVVAFADEYDEPRSGPFHFLDKGSSQDYEVGFANAQVRKVGKRRLYQQDDIYYFNTSWEGIPIAPNYLTYYALSLPEQAIPKDIRIIDPYSKEQYRKNVSRDDLRNRFVIYLECRSLKGMFDFILETEFRISPAEFEKAEFQDDFCNPYGHQIDRYQGYLEPKESTLVQQFFAEKINTGDTYKIKQAGAVGSQAKAHDMTLNQTANQINDSTDSIEPIRESSRLSKTVSQEAKKTDKDDAFVRLRGGDFDAFRFGKLFAQLAKLLKPISILQGKYLGLLVLASFAFGLICGVLSTYFGLFPNASHHVLLVGSGTVRSYLFAAIPELTQRLDIAGSEGNIDLLLLEGGTGTGTRLFADAYDKVDMIVMASNERKLEKDLAQFPDKRPAVFEAFIGNDPLQILLVAKDEPTLNEIFSDLLPKDKEDSLDLEKFVKKVWDNKVKKVWDNEICIKKMSDMPFDVYATSPQSATIEEWEKRFNNAKNGCGWLSDILSWEAQSFKVGEVSRPSIFLGSEALNQYAVTQLGKSHITFRKLFLIGSSGQKETRGLYLYGRVLTHEPDQLKGNGYGLPTPVADTLRYIFGKLEAKASKDKDSAKIDLDCLQKQIKYFHLDQPITGWVQPHGGGHDEIYRAELCPLHQQK